MEDGAPGLESWTKYLREIFPEANPYIISDRLYSGKENQGELIYFKDASPRKEGETDEQYVQRQLDEGKTKQSMPYSPKQYERVAAIQDEIDNAPIEGVNMDEPYKVRIYKNLKQGGAESDDYYPQELRDIYTVRGQHATTPVVDKTSEYVDVEVPKTGKGGWYESVNSFMADNPDIKGYVDTPFRREGGDDAPGMVLNDEFLNRAKSEFNESQVRSMKGSYNRDGSDASGDNESIKWYNSFFPINLGTPSAFQKDLSQDEREEFTFTASNWQEGSLPEKKPAPVKVMKTRGCTDPSAENYNPKAVEDDGSCTYPPPPKKVEEEEIVFPPVDIVFPPLDEVEEDPFAGLRSGYPGYIYEPPPSDWTGTGRLFEQIYVQPNLPMLDRPASRAGKQFAGGRVKVLKSR